MIPYLCLTLFRRQGQPDILEVLPAGASKGNGVEILLKHLGVDPGYVMALG